MIVALTLLALASPSPLAASPPTSPLSSPEAVAPSSPTAVDRFVAPPLAPVAPVAAPIVAVVPLDAATARDVKARAIFDAVEGALPEAAKVRGLGHRRFALVKPIDEAARACVDDTCRRAQAKRLGARYALVVNVGALNDGALTLTMLDVDATTNEHVTVRGLQPYVLSQAPVAVASLLEAVAPRAAFRRADAIARLRKARSLGDDEAAARVCFELAAMLPAEMATWTFDGADLLAEAGRVDEAAAIFSQLALDESLDEDVRIEALARSRVPVDSMRGPGGG